MTRLLLAAIVLALAGMSQAAAQTYPTRPITMIVAYPPGGPTDSLARILIEPLRNALGQPVIIENVSGAGGTIGVARAARAAPDGYTLSIGQFASHVSTPAIYPVTFDVLRDFEPVSLLSNSSLWLIGKAGLPANNLQDLVATLKANPDQATWGTVGAGSAAHLCGLSFENRIGTRLRYVPYRGAALVTQDLIGRQIDLSCLEASTTLPHVRAGRMKAFGIMRKGRWGPAPEVPTMEEAGVSGLHISFWHGLWVPKGTPREVVGKLNSVFAGVLREPAVRERLSALGQEIPPHDQLTPEALAAHHKAEIETWWPIIKAAGIKPE
jgi:tripartite-type tricarboxylate transporter receptor subunit TctC